MEFSYYCSFGTSNFSTCVAHTSQIHVSETLKVKRQELDSNSGILGYRTMNFSIIPDALFQINKEIKTVDLGDRLGIEVIDTEMITLESLENEDVSAADASNLEDSEMIEDLRNLSLLENTPSKSPAAKKIRTSTPYRSDLANTKESHRTNSDLTLSLTLSPGTADEDIEAMEELLEHLPTAMACLRDAGHLETWMALHRLLSMKKFPLNNIAFLLFLDVCKLFSTPNSVSIRYSPVVKRFWRFY